MSTQPLLQRTAAKRIALPVRVEPKVSFANERTFLSWLHFTVVLGGLAVGLLNFGDKVGKISAAMFSVVAMSIMIYALYTYHWRAASIRRGGRGPYDDRLGPTILCIALLGAFCCPYNSSSITDVLIIVAIVVNFILRFTET
ncbi:vacuolar transporter chaperone 1 [Desarmillaria tabescens]|uniref:Vacuolar transporter chaperone 1 n=1 Tax=Armillaria tabescens TaxID=1929756 RepID=A0AA39T6M1_ARMTA|nr:vacuolar transporter chaperone 1 [Desarmillaria tabescens]KAK0468146.1 vacuolar transporter chaperone 1 [Desarmillaria tabescens]